MTKPKKAPTKVLFTWLFLFKLLLNWGYVNLVTLLFPSFPVCYMYVAFVLVYLGHCLFLSRQLVSYCVNLFIHDHTQEPSISFICLVLCNLLMQEGCGYRSYGCLVRKNMTTPPKNPLVSLDHPAHFLSLLSGGCGFMFMGYV